ncbi:MULTISPECIES: DeoR/GlpR family DNA-binding transcription regulator [unclassified Frondihabitans]|uniref:DeoR/GlpR family DNA-binding transcription regulator n=1 Tax=unclassified Frondihabitans TaxID=2626248 RepID=UPI000F51414C|nr:MULTISPECIES: DeoR/GlpR family DNA-binding transcription regulator [unclassified Frondihabitans]RPE78419.1 DeoR family transcriptional regulator [Frondihabitans sp. PhB153]RPF08700.1 DeoR family transcriptional regulator [Frondihabitans sp. PhB161]
MATIDLDVSPRAASSKRSDRMVAIISSLGERGSASFADLATELGVSAATIRRDLADLEDQGLLARTHGGARAFTSAAEVPVGLRDSQFRLAKQLIARRAATLLPDGPYAIAIGGGTTAAGVARALMFRTDLTIVTNSLTTATEIASRPNIKVIMTGGVIRSQSFELVGALAENAFNAINVGTAILGMDGIGSVGGATTHDETEARTNTAMVRHAQRVIVVADSSKVGRVTLAKVADLTEIHDLVTDSGADSDELARIRDRGVRVHVVEVAE